MLQVIITLSCLLLLFTVHLAEINLIVVVVVAAAFNLRFAEHMWARPQKAYDSRKFCWCNAETDSEMPLKGSNYIEIKTVTL